MDVQLMRGKFIFLLLIGLLAFGVSSSWAIVVTSTADSGAGTLRAAITTANADGVATVITFDPTVFPPPPASPGVISLATALPILRGTGDTIDGTGAGVVIDCSGLPANTIGLQIRRSNITIRGLTIENLPGDGIRVVTEAGVTSVTGVVIDSNHIIASGNRGIRVSGGQGPTTSGGSGGGKTVAASITNNTVIDSLNNGILVIGNLALTDDFGGHNVTAIIDGNTVRRSQQNFAGGVTGGDGIEIAGGIGVGSNSVITATVSNNSVHRNFDHGILVNGCTGQNSSGSNNTVYATIINNSSKENGFNGGTVNRDGIRISGAAGATADATTCAGNTLRFNISGNDSNGNRSRNIDVAGGSGSGHDLQGNISGNTAKSSAENDGIQVSGGLGTGNVVHDVSVSGNQSSDNFSDGIAVTGGQGMNAIVRNISVLANHVFNNELRGIIVTGGTDSENAAITRIVIDGNHSTGNANRGIQASLGATTINPTISLAGITNNTASANADDGIFISNGVNGSGTTPVSGNRADRNGVDGIDINATGYVLSNNTASRNAADGINAVGNTDDGGNTGKRNASCNTPGCF